MERLTYDFCIAGKHCWQVKGADNLECGEVCKSRDDEGCNGCPIADAFDRLAAIEDILGDDYDLDRLKELVEADRDGRCIVLPCKVGDKVYCIQSYFNDAKMRSEKKVKCRIVDFVQSFPDLFECYGMIYRFEDIGKTVFLTREEAEAAMKRMEGEEK